MLRTGGGEILNVSTDDRLFPEAPHLALYIASKIGLGPAQPGELPGTQVPRDTVTLVVPGAMEARTLARYQLIMPGGHPDDTATVIEALDVAGT